jgi:hypothetical protein
LQILLTLTPLDLASSRPLLSPAVPHPEVDLSIETSKRSTSHSLCSPLSPDRQQGIVNVCTTLIYQVQVRLGGREKEQVRGMQWWKDRCEKSFAPNGTGWGKGSSSSLLLLCLLLLSGSTFKSRLRRKYKDGRAEEISEDRQVERMPGGSNGSTGGLHQQARRTTISIADTAVGKTCDLRKGTLSAAFTVDHIQTSPRSTANKKVENHQEPQNRIDGTNNTDSS